MVSVKVYQVIVDTRAWVWSVPFSITTPVWRYCWQIAKRDGTKHFNYSIQQFFFYLLF